MLQILRMTPSDEAAVLAADALFDRPSDPEAVRAFLAGPDHYLLIAYVDAQPAGFVKGHVLPRLDTPRPMLFLYELGVDAGFRGRGIGTALVRELARLGRERDCREMFVLTNEANVAAMRTYAAAGGERCPEIDIVMWEWAWPPSVARAF